MKNLIFLLLTVILRLSVNAQVTINPSAIVICQDNSVTFVANATGYDTDTLNFTWLQNGVGFGMPNNDTITYVPSVGSWNININVTTPGGQFVGTGLTTLTVNPNPTPTASNGGPYCVDDIMQLNASGGTSYSWSGFNGFSSYLQNPVVLAEQSWTYTVTVTDTNGCSATATTSVVVNPLPNAQIIVDDTICENDTLMLIAKGGVSYVWGNTGEIGDTIYNYNSLPGIGVYTVTVTDANSCTASALTKVLTINKPELSVSYGNDPCVNAPIDAVVSIYRGDDLNPQYLWSDGQAGDSVILLPGATYSVTAVTGNGCQAEIWFPIPLITVTDLSISYDKPGCVGASDGAAWIIVNGISPFNYNWSTGDSSIGIQNIPAGTYTVTVTDANGCETTDSINIPDPLVWCTGIQEEWIEGNIDIFPNPISLGSSVTITLPNHDVTIEVINITGQILFQDETSVNVYLLNTSGLSSGTYMIRIASHDQIITKRLIVQ